MIQTGAIAMTWPEVKSLDDIEKVPFVGSNVRIRSAKGTFFNARDKKVLKIFGGVRKKHYLCTRNSETTVTQSLLSVSNALLSAKVY